MIHKHTKIVALIVTSIFLLALVGFVGFGYVVGTQKVKLNEALTAAAELKMQEESLSTLVKTVESSKADRTELDSIILTEEGVIDLLTLIESLGVEQGVSLKTSTLTVSPVGDLFEALTVTVSVEGSYSAVMHITKLLETLPYQSSVPKVFLQQVEDAASQWQGTIEVRVTKFKKV